MNVKLQFASILTLGVLFGFVFAILGSALFLLKIVDIVTVLISTVGFGLIMWLIGPFIQDMTFRIFYKIEFMTIDEVAKEDPGIADFIKKVCAEHRIKVPKIGIIDDGNPTAFCYGSGAFNARLVMTEGISTYLDEEEVKAVIAHELGHIINRDFIVMSLASTLLQILYELYNLFAGKGKDSKGERKLNVFMAIGIVSYIFYKTGSFVMLYLSRVREYAADEFSAEKTRDPNALTNALIKIAYGIMKDEHSDKSQQLLESTRALGIFDIHSSKDLGLVYVDYQKDHEKLSKVMLYDFYNPWAFFLELSSTHPLTGKRIRRLNELSKKYGVAVDLDIEKYKPEIDRKRLYESFAIDLLVYYSPVLFAVLAALVTIFGFHVNPVFGVFTLLRYALIGCGLGVMLKAFYAYTKKAPEKTTVFELMTDLYASPLRGRHVLIDGRVIGRGTAGYELSEDMMYQDSTGLIYLNYESAIPLIGNLIFATSKLKKTIGEGGIAEGWFFRGLTRHIDLKRLTLADRAVKSYVDVMPYLLGIALVILGVII